MASLRAVYRERNVLRAVLSRILETEGDSFTIPSVAAGIDATLLPHVVPECGRRAIRKLVRMGYVVPGDGRDQYRLGEGGSEYIGRLLRRGQASTRLLEIFLMPDDDAIPEEEPCP